MPTISEPATPTLSSAASCLHLLEEPVDGGHPVVVQVDRHLGQVVLVHEPAHALDLPEASGLGFAPAGLPQVEGDAVGLAGRAQDVDVVGDEEHPRARGRGAPFRHELGGAEIRRPPGVLEALGQPLVFSPADVREFAAPVVGGGLLIEKKGDPEFLRGPPGEGPGDIGAVRHGHPPDGDEGADVHGPEAGMLALVPSHVDAHPCHAGGGQCPLHDGLGVSDKGVDGAVRGCAGIHVQEGAARRPPDRFGDGFDGFLVSAFGKIGDAFDDGFHGEFLGTG